MEKFQLPTLELIKFENEDIIRTSGEEGNECEPWDIKNPNCP